MCLGKQQNNVDCVLQGVPGYGKSMLIVYIVECIG